MCKASLAFFPPTLRTPCSSLHPTLFPHRGPQALKSRAGLRPPLRAHTRRSACKVETQSSRVAIVFKRQTCFLILLTRSVSRELDLGVEYNYLFLSDLTHHSWEPNLVEKTKFQASSCLTGSQSSVSEIRLKRAVLVVRCPTSEAEVHGVRPRKTQSQRERSRKQVPRIPQGAVNI